MVEARKVDIEKFVEDFCALTLMEAAEVCKILEEKLGISAFAPAPAMAGAAAVQAAPVEEKTEFTAVLVAIGDKKIDVIKEVRVYTGLGLKEAKDFVEAAADPSKPQIIKAGISKEDAEKIKVALEKVGAKVELK